MIHSTYPHRVPLLVLVLCCLLKSDGHVMGQTFFVEVSGVVEFNQITFGTLGEVVVGDTAILFFAVDADDFVDSPNFSTRGYRSLDVSSPGLVFTDGTFGEDVILTIEDPFPSGQTPYFVIRNDDPAVDGFFVSTSVDFPFGSPLNQAGQVTQFENDFSVTYTGDTLSSLDVRDAAGYYDLRGLTVFNWTINDGPFSPLGIVFEQMHIGEFFIDYYCDFPLGDVNMDEQVDLLDVSSFLEFVLNGVYVCEADINMDGVVDLLDVAPFVAIIAGG